MDANTVKALRLYLGLTQKEFAGKIGVGRHSVSNMERGITPVSLRVRMKIAQRYDVSQEFLTTLERTRDFGSI